MYVSPIDSFKLQEPEKKYNKLMLLFIDSPDHFEYIDQLSYDNFILPHFNNVPNYRHRKNVSKCFEDVINKSKTRVIRSDHLFNAHQTVSYQQFTKEVESSRIEGLIIIHLQNPNWINVYLCDWENHETVWIGHQKVHDDYGIDFPDLHKHLAVNITYTLRSLGYIHGSTKELFY